MTTNIAVLLVCNLDAFTREERVAHLERTRRVYSAIRRLREEASGFVFTFRADEALENEVGLWIAGERRCCSFFRFVLERHRGGIFSVRVTGPETAKAILRASLAEHGATSHGRP
jgi:hypothetical protein